MPIKNDSKCYLIIIKDSTFLAGKTIYNLFKILIEFMPYKYVICDYLDISGNGQKVRGAISIPYHENNKQLQ